MITIVIADDDELALAALKEMIHVKNVKVSAVFTQSQDALDYIKEQQPDILITDMKMPRIDGIELIKMAKQMKPDIQVIAVSSYKDFNYVKESFREGSVDYILKHMLTEETVTQALLEAMSRVKRNEKKQDNFAVMEESRNILREKIFSQMLKEEIPVEKAADLLQKYKLSLDVGSTMVMVCEIDGYASISERFQDEDKRIFLNAIRNIIDRVTEKVPERVIIKISEECYAILMTFADVKSQLYIYSSCAQYAQHLNTNVKKLMNVDMSVSLGRPCMSLADIAASFQECRNMLKEKFFEGKGKVYDNYTGIKERKPQENGQSKGMFSGSKVHQKISAMDESCVGDVKQVFQYYKENKIPAMVIELGIVEMLNVGYRIVDEKDLDEIRQKENFHIMYGKIKKLTTADEICSAIQEFYRDIISELKKRNSAEQTGYSKYTCQTIKYVGTNYKTAVSLQDLAEEMGIHYAYLSKVFKQDTGVNFGEYLNHIRIEKAKELIKSGNYTIKEISAEVGFNQYNYFFKVFKQAEGCTPTEYEKKIKIV
mgnify:CR=1 FL=1